MLAQNVILTEQVSSLRTEAILRKFEKMKKLPQNVSNFNGNGNVRASK
jgi:hypothetical protein